MGLLIKENIILFDRMHEGLIVISEADKRLTFASKPAIQLLQTPNTPIKEENPLDEKKCHSESKALDDDDKRDFDENSLQKAIFIPATASLERKHTTELLGSNDNGKISLKSIIEN